MAPVPPKRPTGTGTPRRSTASGARVPPRRAPAQEPPPEVAPATDQTVMGMDQPDLETEPPPPADATVVFDTTSGGRKAPSAGPVGTLVVLKGPKQGAEFTLGPGETSIGRNAENTIVVPDISVSRKHVVLVKEGQGWVLQDQGSGNGTLVNGEKVDEHPLQNGDVFVIGDTEMQFVLQGGAPTRRSTSQVPQRRPSRASSAGLPARASPGNPVKDSATGQVALPPEMLGALEKKKKMRVIIAASAGVAAVMMVGAMIAHHNTQMRELARRAAIEAEAKAQAEAADADVAEGKQLVLAGKFAEALPKFKDAKEKNSEDPEVDDYIARCSREISSEQALKDASDALTKWQLATAMAAAKKVPIDSLLSDKAEDMKKQVKAAIPQRVALARGMIAGKDFSGASAILEDAAKVDPDDKTISDAQDELAKAQNRPPPVHVTHSTVRAVDHSGEIVQAFKDGDLKRAKELAAQFGESDDNARRLGQEIGQFESAYNALDSDKSAYRTAHDLDLRIAKGHSFFSQKINSHYEAVSLKQCVTAKTAGKLGDAYRACQAAHDINPSNGDANAVLQELASKAKETYLEAYQEMGSDAEAARRGFNQVIATTPAGDDYHQKAQQRLRELNQQ